MKQQPPCSIPIIRGELYRTRSGLKVRIFATDVLPQRDVKNVHGEYLQEIPTGFPHWFPCDWWPDGTYWPFRTDKPSEKTHMEMDIVGSWHKCLQCNGEKCLHCGKCRNELCEAFECQQSFCERKGCEYDLPVVECNGAVNEAHLAQHNEEDELDHRARMGGRDDESLTAAERNPGL